MKRAIALFPILTLSMSAFCAHTMTDRREYAAMWLLTSDSAMSIKRAVSQKTTPVVPTAITFVSELPISRSGSNRSMYTSGIVRDTAIALLSGLSVSKIPRVSTVENFLLGKHLGERGRDGWRFSVLIDGKTIHNGPLNLDSLKPDQMVRLCNPVAVDTIVNSRFPRAAAVTLAEIVAARATKLANAPTANAPTANAPTANAPTANAPTANAPTANAPTAKRKRAK